VVIEGLQQVLKTEDRKRMISQQTSERMWVYAYTRLYKECDVISFKRLLPMNT